MHPYHSSASLKVSSFQSVLKTLLMCQKRHKMGWILGASIMVAAGLGYANYSWYKTVKIPYEHIANAKLVALDDTSKTLLGQDLWKGGNGAVVMVIRRAG